MVLELQKMFFVAYRDIECIYPVSGQYGRAPRALYYALLLFVLIYRRHIWLAAGAAASCITFGGATAVHAFILACIRAASTPLVQDSSVSLNQTDSVLVQSRVLDLDVDATLAVVGAGFLTLLPLAIGSSSFRNSGAQPILVLWGLLMLIGMLCCLVNLYAINASANGPFHQYRFCPPHHNDSLPLFGPSVPNLPTSWNKSVAQFFKQNSTSDLNCFYPCAASFQLLRQQSEIQIIPFPAVRNHSPEYWALYILVNIVYGCMPVTILACISLFILRFCSTTPTSETLGYRSILRNLDILASSPINRKMAYQMLLVMLQVYALVITPLILLTFVALAEWSISFDPESESIQHIGQWAPLVGVALVLVGAFLSKYWPTLRDCHVAVIRLGWTWWSWTGLDWIWMEWIRLRRRSGWTGLNLPWAPG
ncbi:MAG: hypothetical protein M1840_001521 [Geoglossum simile]|nr:MAG: hypothetical protein M1840_001521 [Geoglossum simile]